jgi:hypothetical protein
MSRKYKVFVSMRFMLLQAAGIRVMKEVIIGFVVKIFVGGFGFFLIFVLYTQFNESRM